MGEPEPCARPSCVLLFSGKRKCGKDFLTDALHLKLGGGERSVVVRLSGPIKEHWSRERGVCLEELLGSGQMKEQHRKHMIEWSESIRNRDPGYFCRAALNMYNAGDKAVWIVSDARRRTDISWFREKFGSAVITLRITADDAVRAQRGWTFTPGIDDAETECDLDGYTDWDEVLCNDGNTDCEVLVSRVVRRVESLLCSPLSG